MCGIVGIVGPSARATKDESFSNALDTLCHRGPDYKNICRDERAIFGHTRLSILDLSDRANQPMISSDGRYVLVYNGEIYNFPALKAQLLNEGVSLQSTGDTEVLLQTMIRWGVDGLDKLNGMFAFAFYDRWEKELLLVRDRFGVKPLFYEDQPGGVAFASELKALRKLSNGQKLNEQAAAVYFTIGYNYSPLTVWQNIYKLPAGHLLQWKNGKSQIKKWYYPNHINEKINDWEMAKTQLWNNLEEAVSDRMLSDVPIGAFLSGGIDSSIIVGLMQRVSNANIKTFTVTYNGLANYDESAYARRVAEKFGTQHTELQVGTDEVKDIIPKVLDSLDEPFADPSILPTYLICREIRKHIKVALSGDGADEIFAGYRKYLGEYYMSRWWIHLIYPWCRYVVGLLPASRRNAFTEQIRRVKRFLSGVDTDPINRHLNWMTLFPAEIVSNILPFDVSPTNEVKGTIKKLYGEMEDSDRVNKMLYTDQSLVLEGNMLPKIDMMSMLNGLEVRSPFMDYRLIRSANSMPGNFKFNRGKSKVILRDMFKDFLPEETLRRDKQGFDIPIGEWFRDEYRDMFWDVIKTAFRKKGIIPKPVEKAYKDHIKEKQDNSRILWSLFVWCWWWNKNF